MRVLRRVRPAFTFAVGLLSASALVGISPADAAGTGAASAPAFDQLFGVTASSGRNAWAVGFYVDSKPGFHAHTLIEHWNGRRWAHVRSPDPRGPFSDVQLTGVAAPSAARAWAVGWTATSAGDRTLIERWNGRAWKIQKSPDVAGFSDQLEGATATSRRHAWAVGNSSGASGGEHSLIERWNGRKWRKVAIPNPRGSAVAGLSGVAATSASNAWAVGSYGNPQPGSLGLLTLIEHWDGRAWKRVPSPSPGGPTSFNELNAVAAASPASAWTVGMVRNVSTGATQNIIEHWNGRTWKQAASPTPGTDSSLLGVAATSRANAWAVGGYAKGTGHGHTLIEHWNGRTWKRVPSPSPGGANTSTLFGVTATSRSNAWAAGFYLKGNAVLTLIEHWNGKAWKQVPSPNPTG